MADRGQPIRLLTVLPNGWQTDIVDLAAKASWYNPDDPAYPPGAGIHICRSLQNLWTYVDLADSYQHRRR